MQTQIASFDEFVQNTIQELVDESPILTLSSNAGAAGREDDENAEDARRHEIQVPLKVPWVDVVWANLFVAADHDGGGWVDTAYVPG